MRPTFVTIGPTGEILSEGSLARGISVATGRGLPVLVDQAPAGAALGQNPEPSKSAVGALKAAGLRPISLAEVRAMPLEEAYRRISPLFLKMRWFAKSRKEEGPREHVGTESGTYRSPRLLARSWIGGNYKLGKRPDTGATAKILVEGVSLLPHALALEEGATSPLFAEYYDDVKKIAAKLPKNFTLCVGSSPNCRAACLCFSGHNWMIQKNTKIKMAKTIALLKEPVAWLRFLHFALEAFAAEKADYHFVRLNVLQDIPWEAFAPWIFTEFPGLHFYDYTKVAARVTPSNYDLSFSFSGINEALSKRELAAGRRVAVVFLGMRLEGEVWKPFKTSKEEAAEPTIGELFDNPPPGRKYSPIPERFWGFPVVDGDVSDLRSLDIPSPCIVALRFKTPFGQEINPDDESFAFATKAYVVKDKIVRLSRNPSGKREKRTERVEYLIAGLPSRMTGFQYDPRTRDDDGAALLEAQAALAKPIWIDAAGQLGAGS